MAGGSVEAWAPGVTRTGADPVKVLFICACGRSGSTILGDALGELEGFFHAGELRTLWGWGLTRGRLCGCGVPVGRCEFWRTVLDEGFTTWGGAGLEAESINRLYRSVVRIRNLPRMLGESAAPPRWTALRDYGRIAARLYRAIAVVAEVGVVVDSSKRPGDAALLRFLPGIEPYCVHLVRDPRAVAFSWQRHKASPSEGERQEMLRHSATTVARNWIVENVAAEAVRRRSAPATSVLVRYEDFVAHPTATLGNILRVVREDRTSPFQDDRSIVLHAGHTAGGNPDRFRTGAVELREDREWLHRQHRMDRSITTAVALPLLNRYGYRFLPA